MIPVNCRDDGRWIHCHCIIKISVCVCWGGGDIFQYLCEAINAFKYLSVSPGYKTAFMVGVLSWTAYFKYFLKVQIFQLDYRQDFDFTFPKHYLH